jgi:Domain of unknown function DUF29
MRITLDIDDDLYAKALELAGADLAPEDLVLESLQTFVRVQAAQRLAALGGSMPEIKTDQYDQDVNAWANEQARWLRGRRFDVLDIEHIANEIAGVGKREQRELASSMAALFAQLLKWAYQPERRSPGWQKTIMAQRKEIAYLLGESPSLALKLQESLWLDVVWTCAVAHVVTETELDCFLGECPWSIQAEVLCDTWLPAE